MQNTAFLVAFIWMLVAAQQPYTLAGVTLGMPVAQVEKIHTNARKSPNGKGWLLHWKRSEGGSVDVYSDGDGVVTHIHFTADRDEEGSIDLPCAGLFEIRNSHVNLGFAVDPKVCVPEDISTYRLADGSILDVRFVEPGDGPLHEADWSRPRR